MLRFMDGINQKDQKKERVPQPKKEKGAATRKKKRAPLPKKKKKGRLNRKKERGATTEKKKGAPQPKFLFLEFYFVLIKFLNSF